MSVASQRTFATGAGSTRPTRRYCHPTCSHARAVTPNAAAALAVTRSSGRTSTTNPEPSASLARKSGACRWVAPSASVQCSQNGWEDTPATSGSKSSSIRCYRSGQDSNPT
jgi:hypothetical protein